MLLCMSYKAVLVQPSSWITYAIGSNCRRRRRRRPCRPRRPCPCRCVRGGVDCYVRGKGGGSPLVVVLVVVLAIVVAVVAFIVVDITVLVFVL
jgi:hypothetical protein